MTRDAFKSTRKIAAAIAALRHEVLMLRIAPLRLDGDFMSEDERQSLLKSFREQVDAARTTIHTHSEVLAPAVENVERFAIGIMKTLCELESMLSTFTDPVNDLTEVMGTRLESKVRKRIDSCERLSDLLEQQRLELEEIARYRFASTDRLVKKVRGRKPGRKLGDRNPDAKENAVIKAHRRGQNHEETAKIANVFNKDGRPDTRRVNRILRAYKRANPGHKFPAPNS